MFRVSIDVGGTFTDLVVLNEETGRLINYKVPSVPRNPEKGVMNALQQFFAISSPDNIRMIGHATTIATNALFGQIDLELPRVGLITTQGFRDIVEIGRQQRAEVYNLFFTRPPMLAERRFRYEMEERIDAEGRIHQPIDEERVKEVLLGLKGEGVKSIAVGFLNSYANNIHEKIVEEIYEDLQISPYLTLSSDVSREYREYERFSTALVNAALLPIINKYLQKLSNDLQKREIRSQLYIMQSNGGLSSVEEVSKYPYTIVESGPAAGVIASAWLGSLSKEDDIISFDMGGTTAKAGTIRGMMPEVVPEYEVAGKIHLGRIIKGSGYPVRFPFIDLAECSAGGGTIAWSEEGSLRVGPISAGADPGPACYGRGGTKPTITDANLLLGRLNPEELLGGDMKIYPKYAINAIKELSENITLEGNPEDIALGILFLANSLMSKILRIVSVERGYDPTEFTLVAFGGAGPMHACALAEELGMGRILIPMNPGMFSALGLLTSNFFHDYIRAIVKNLEDVDPESVEQIFQNMELEGENTLIAEGIEEDKISYRRQLDLRYHGQAYELSIDCEKPFTPASIRDTIDRFHDKHHQVYGYSSPGETIELINIRLRAIGHISKPRLVYTKSDRISSYPRDLREVFFEYTGEWMETPIYDRNEIGGSFRGPAIIEQYDATTIVYPEWSGKLDEFGNIILRKKEFD
jgi:N-methylhydantoinase A